MRLTIVTTLYCSAAYIREFHARVAAASDAFGFDWDLVMVNDGSPDDSLAVATEIALADPRVLVVDLSRNFGHHKAMMTGLMHAEGDLVLLMDSDLEEAPEWLEDFHRKLVDEKLDVVYGVQAAARRGGLFERVSGHLYYSVFNWLSDAKMPRNLLTMRLMTRRYVKALVRHQEREMMIGGLWVITGFAQAGLPVKKLTGSPSTYTLARKLQLLVDAITTFSNKPLVLIFNLGITITAVSLGAATFQLIRVLFFQALLPGWASLIISIWLFGGITIFCLGLIGIYLSKIYTETKQRPYTIVRELIRHASVPDAALSD